MKYKQKAFTLVEMMVVVGLVSILLVLTLTNAKKQRVISRDNARVADIKTMRLALEDYKLTCGQYPPRFESTSHNDSGPCDTGSGITLGDFISNIPEGPSRNYPFNSTSGNVGHSHSIVDGSGYFYAGLSSTPNGKCYDYHIAAELEQSTDNGFDKDSSFLKKDHDFSTGLGKYRFNCKFAALEFDADDDASGLYDFRSTKSF